MTKLYPQNIGGHDPPLISGDVNSPFQESHENAELPGFCFLLCVNQRILSVKKSSSRKSADQSFRTENSQRFWRLPKSNVTTLPEAKTMPENRPSQKDNNPLPTLDFQVRTVSLGKGIPTDVTIVFKNTDFKQRL